MFVDDELYPFVLDDDVVVTHVVVELHAVGVP